MSRSLTAAVCVLAGLTAPALAQTPAAAPPDSVYVPASSYVDKIAKTNNGSITHGLPASPGTSVGVIHRDAVGLVDIHGKWNEQFVIVQGTADMKVGGKMIGGRQTGSNEWHGDAIEGGQTYKIGPGDVIWVKMGVPHQMILPPGGDIRYFIFKDQTTTKP